jgi:site-specific DNA recombinase
VGRTGSLAEAAGWPVVESIKDALSGFSLERAGLERLRFLLKEGLIDVMIVHAVDRLSRNQNHIGVLFDEVQRAGARLEFVTEKFEDNAIGRFILAARAFVGEVEREKIVERTSRGKRERALSGRIPQATGKGIYGYTYNPSTGKRIVNRKQAKVVQRIFQAFNDGQSCNGISNRLNESGEPAFGGGSWYPPTVRRVLLNETYTGRTIFRRTKVVTVRNPRTGKMQRRVEVRDKEEWVEIKDATPAIIDHATFEKAQATLSDPARRLIGQPSHLYKLRGHVRCLHCGTPMVGQALQRGRYRYYRCRRTYAGRHELSCQSRYVNAAALEQTVLREIEKLLADEGRILEEARLFVAQDTYTANPEILQTELDNIEAQQKRLVRLYTAGNLPEALLTEEGERLAQEKRRKEQEKHQLTSAHSPSINLTEVARDLPQVIQFVRNFIRGTGQEDMSLLLRALEIEVRASQEQIEIAGSLPPLHSFTKARGRDLVTIERTSA